MDKTLELVGDMFYEGGYLRVSDLVKRFVEIESQYADKPWNLYQILSNIHSLIPMTKEEVLVDEEE